MAEENEKLEREAAASSPEEEAAETEKSGAGQLRLREIFHQAFGKARREQQPVASRRELGRDRSRSLFLLVGAAVGILLLFLGVFSSPKNVKKAEEGRRVGTPNLGRKVTPGQEIAQSGSVTPLLNADPSSGVQPLSQEVTPEDVSKTARPAQPSVPMRQPERTWPKVKDPEQYTLGRIDFSDPALAQQPGYGAPPPAGSTGMRPEVEELRKPSLVFVRAAQANAPSGGAQPVAVVSYQSPVGIGLPVGTRLVARLLVEGLKYDVHWRLLDLWNDMCLVGQWCLDIDHEGIRPLPQPQYWEAGAVLAGVCALCLIYLSRRTRAVEVIR